MAKMGKHPRGASVHRFVRDGWIGVALLVLVAGAAGAQAPAELDPTFAAVDRFIADREIDTSQEGWKTRLPRPPRFRFSPGRHYFWHLETNVGSLKIRFFHAVAPRHVSSTIYLTRLGFYDDVRFHRVIPGFMAQGGDPEGTGRGGPGYTYGGEFDPDVKHDRPGLLSMANKGPNTDGSQFFLTFDVTDWLDGKHTIFGEVVEGKGTLKALEQRGSRSGAPREKLVIRKATVSVE